VHVRSTADKGNGGVDTVVRIEVDTTLINYYVTFHITSGVLISHAFVATLVYVHIPIRTQHTNCKAAISTCANGKHI
jgi:hypothetical protein